MPSTVIRAFCYDPAEHRLDVLFVNGRCYSYHDVPARTASALWRAASKGGYFNRKIRDQYRFTRMRSRSGETASARLP